MPTTPIPITDLTAGTLAGAGVFDALMRATKAHLDAEYADNRLRGPEYATVYLGSLQATLEAAMAFLVQRSKANAELAEIEARIALLEQQRLNAVVENDVLVAQKCKLQAEFDVIMLTKEKTTAETNLLNQKKATEAAQISNTGVAADSVIGRQNALYLAQTNGFTRDAEQKVAKLMIDSWNVRRTTDEATSANTTNKLDDASVGRAVNKLLEGVGA